MKNEEVTRVALVINFTVTSFVHQILSCNSDLVNKDCMRFSREIKRFVREQKRENDFFAKELKK